MLYEYRWYEVLPGQYPRLARRFEDRVVPLLQKHNLRPVGYLAPDVGATDQLEYLFAFDSFQQRDEAYGSFVGDPDWADVVAETAAAGGDPAKVVHNEIWITTPISPEVQIGDWSQPATGLYEHRKYEVLPDQAPRYLDFYGTSMLPLCRKHGFKIIGSFQPIIGASNQLHLIFGFDSPAHRDEAYAALLADPAYDPAVEKAHADGPIVERVTNTLWRPASWSPAIRDGVYSS